MKTTLLILGLLMVTNTGFSKTVHEFEVETLQGKKTSLKSYSGKVLLIVNTASKCGYTPQYQDLQSLYNTYKGKGLV
ncbi:MAG: glutathione peroxidase, partial [Proteobacteria bacterium]|nr:glutathione peroxidase [Pseudomonadota bacterium]